MAEVFPNTRTITCVNCGAKLKTQKVHFRELKKIIVMDLSHVIGVSMKPVHKTLLDKYQNPQFSVQDILSKAPNPNANVDFSLTFFRDYSTYSGYSYPYSYIKKLSDILTQLTEDPPMNQKCSFPKAKFDGPMIIRVGDYTGFVAPRLDEKS